jgi:multiple sugar transport system substrate-binding protein
MITLIGPDDPALNALENTFKTGQVPVTSEVTGTSETARLLIIPWAEYRDRLMETLTAGEAPHQAVFVPGHIWLPELAEAGYLAPLDQIRPPLPDTGPHPAERLLAEMLPSVSAEAHYQGRSYLFPLFTDGHILFYRQDLLGEQMAQAHFTRSGVPLISPMALAELAEQAHNPPKVYGLALKAHPSEIFLDWLPFLWAAGGDLLDEAGEPAFAGQAGVRALEYYTRLRRFCPPDTHLYGNAEILEIIKKGQAALVTTWGGQAGPLYASGAGRAYRTAIFPRPWNAAWGAAIPANQPAERQQAALSVLLSAFGPETDLAVITAAGSPVRRSSYAPEQLETHPWLPAQLAMLERCGRLPDRPEVGRFLGALYGAVYSAFTEEQTPQAALKQAEAEARQALGL